MSGQPYVEALAALEQRAWDLHGRLQNVEAERDHYRRVLEKIASGTVLPESGMHVNLPGALAVEIAARALEDRDLPPRQP